MNAPALSVVAGVDGSDAGTRAVQWAARAAERAGLPLHLVHAIPTLPTSPYPMGGLYLDTLRKVAREDGQHFLDTAQAAALEVAPAVETLLWQKVGEPVELLISASASARMVVVGPTGSSGLTGMLAGSTALELPSRSQAPVVIVRERTGGDTAVEESVTVGVSGSMHDEAAVEFAFDQASTLGAELVAVHSWSDSPLPEIDRITGQRSDWKTILERERRLLAERLAGYRERYPDVRVRPIVVYDKPARALSYYARSAQLLVVGTRGRGTLAGIMLGSTSRAVIKVSPCPVAVVRHSS